MDFASFYKNTPFSIVHGVTARSATVCGQHMCDIITVRHRRTFYIDRGFMKYVCFNFSLFCFIFHWIVLTRRWLSCIYIFLAYRKFIVIFHFKKSKTNIAVGDKRELMRIYEFMSAITLPLTKRQLLAFSLNASVISRRRLNLILYLCY